MGGFSNFGLVGGYRKPSNINVYMFFTSITPKEKHIKKEQQITPK